METLEILIICGPTASGKSALALDWAEKKNGEIISVDSLQIYKGMDIGTAKPDAAMRARVRHHCIDLVEPDQPFTAADFAREAAYAARDIAARGKVPILAGGAGLYFDALLKGFFVSPKPDAALRKKWDERARALGPCGLHEYLRRVDPASAADIHPNNIKRLLRAIEVFEMTGSPMSVQKPSRTAALPCRVRECCFVNTPRVELYTAIQARTETMYQNGLIAETQGLLNRYPAATPALHSIGYGECLEVLDGLLSPGEALEKTARLTRNYAKRQVTWFKNKKYC